MYYRFRFLIGSMKVCLHQVVFFYDIRGVKITGEDEHLMKEKAKDEVTRAISQGETFGDLHCETYTPIQRRIRVDFEGLWQIAPYSCTMEEIRKINPLVFYRYASGINYNFRPNSDWVKEIRQTECPERVLEIEKDYFFRKCA